MNYYKGNAVYDALEKRCDPRFLWVSGNAWILLYADRSANARVLALVTGISTSRASGYEQERLVRARNIVPVLARKAGIVHTFIEFDDTEATIKEVIQDGQRKSLEELKQWCANVGLAVAGGSTNKAINDASSSAYHKWQREYLGAIKVSDIDLLRIDPSSEKIIEICELKRSFIDINIWKPYPIDFVSFDVVANFARQINAHFSIVYNVRQTKPIFCDDAATVSVFSYSKISGSIKVGVMVFEDFANRIAS